MHPLKRLPSFECSSLRIHFNARGVSYWVPFFCGCYDFLLLFNGPNRKRPRKVLLSREPKERALANISTIHNFLYRFLFPKERAKIHTSKVWPVKIFFLQKRAGEKNVKHLLLFAAAENVCKRFRAKGPVPWSKQRPQCNVKWKQWSACGLSFVGLLLELFSRKEEICIKFILWPQIFRKCFINERKVCSKNPLGLA